jgi:hypothetical protein
VPEQTLRRREVCGAFLRNLGGRLRERDHVLTLALGDELLVAHDHLTILEVNPAAADLDDLLSAQALPEAKAPGPLHPPPRVVVAACLKRCVRIGVAFGVGLADVVERTDDRLQLLS